MNNLKKFLLTLKLLFLDPRTLIEEQKNYYTGLRFATIILGGVTLLSVVIPLFAPEISTGYDPNYPTLIQSVFDGRGEFMETFNPSLMIALYWSLIILPLRVVYRKDNWAYVLSVSFFSLTFVFLVQQILALFPIPRFWSLWMAPLIALNYFIVRTLRQQLVIGLVALNLLYLPFAYIYYTVQGNVLERVFPMIVYSQKFQFDYPETTYASPNQLFLNGEPFPGNIAKTYPTEDRTFASVWNYEKGNYYLYDLVDNGRPVLDEPINFLMHIQTYKDSWKAMNLLKTDLEVITIKNDYQKIHRDTLKQVFFKDIRNTFKTDVNDHVGLLGTKELGKTSFPATAFYSFQRKALLDTLVWGDLALENQSFEGLYFSINKYFLITSTSESIKIAVTDAQGHVEFIRTLFEENSFQNIGPVKTLQLDEENFLISFCFPSEFQHKIFVARINIKQPEIVWQREFDIPNDWIYGQTLDVTHHNGKLYFMFPGVFYLNYTFFKLGAIPCVFAVSLDGELLETRYFSAHQGNYFHLSEELFAECFYKDGAELKVVFRHLENMALPLFAEDQTFFHPIDF